MSRPSLRRFTPPRVVAAVAVALLVGAPFASVAHLIAVPHEACPEHGELIHGEHGAAATDGAQRQFAAVAADADTDAETGAHEHDHCMLASTASERSTWATAPTVHVLAPRVVPAPVLAGADVGLAPAGLYRLAPKTSPPA